MPDQQFALLFRYSDEASVYAAVRRLMRQRFPPQYLGLYLEKNLCLKEQGNGQNISKIVRDVGRKPDAPGADINGFFREDTFPRVCLSLNAHGQHNRNSKVIAAISCGRLWIGRHSKQYSKPFSISTT